MGMSIRQFKYIPEDTPALLKVVQYKQRMVLLTAQRDLNMRVIARRRRPDALEFPHADANFRHPAVVVKSWAALSHESPIQPGNVAGQWSGGASVRSRAGTRRQFRERHGRFQGSIARSGTADNGFLSRDSVTPSFLTSLARSRFGWLNAPPSFSQLESRSRSSLSPADLLVIHEHDIKRRVQPVHFLKFHVTSFAGVPCLQVPGQKRARLEAL